MADIAIAGLLSCLGMRAGRWTTNMSNVCGGAKDLI